MREGREGTLGPHGRLRRHADHGLTGWAATSPAAPSVLLGTGSSGPVPTDAPAASTSLYHFPAKGCGTPRSSARRLARRPPRSAPGVVIGCAPVLNLSCGSRTYMGEVGTGGTILTNVSRCWAAHGPAGPARDHVESEGAA